MSRWKIITGVRGSKKESAEFLANYKSLKEEIVQELKKEQLDQTGVNTKSQRVTTKRSPTFS